MSWEYDVRSKTFTRDGSQRFQARYAGAEGFKDNPDLECIKDKGPLPRGTYTIGPPEINPKTGAYSLRLTPHAGNSMCGRSAFLIHGESGAHPGKASNGCIVLDLYQRREIWISNDHTLVVK